MRRFASSAFVALTLLSPSGVGAATTIPGTTYRVIPNAPQQNPQPEPTTPSTPSTGTTTPGKAPNPSTMKVIPAPLSEIFVKEPIPEWGKAHIDAFAGWLGHKAYHEAMEKELSDFETKWAPENSTEAYKNAKRTLMQHLQLEHRRMHEAFFEPLVPVINGSGAVIVPETVVPQVMEDDMMEEVPPTSVVPAEPTQVMIGTRVLTGRNALFTPLPKESHRLLQKRVDYRNNVQ